MAKLRAGIIGLGVGEKHIRAYQKHPQYKLVALCDFNPERARFMKQKYSNLRMEANANILLDDPDIDIISIASYDNYHYEQVMRALENNKHVFVEKPLCINEEHAKAIKSYLLKKELKLSSNLVLRVSPRFQELKQMIEQDQLGELFYIEGDYNYGRLNKITDGWRGQIEGYSGVYGGGVHVIDLLLWLTKDKVVEVSAYGNSICSRESKFKNKDMVVCLLKFASGMIGKMAVNLGCVFPHFHCLMIYGTKATYENDIDQAYLYLNRDRKERTSIKTVYRSPDQENLLLNFLDAVAYGSEQNVNEEEIFSAMSVCFAIEEAVHTGKIVEVRYI